MEFRSLRPDELDRWAAHCGEVFFAGSGEYFLAHWHNDPWRDLNGIFVAADGDRIVSTVRVFRRKVWLLGEQVPMGGVGEVSTHPDFRGRGLAGTLLGMAVDYMVREGLAVSLLFADAHGFYRKHGWECLPKPMVKYARASAPPCAGRAARPDDLPALMAVEAASAKTDWMAVRTEPAYWQTWIAAELDRCVVATEGGSVIAYMAYQLNEGDWSVTEFHSLPGHERLFGGLCALAAELDGLGETPCWAPAWLPGCSDAVETATMTYCMVRLNLPFTAGGRAIDSTEGLIAETRECRDSNLDHF